VNFYLALAAQEGQLLSQFSAQETENGARSKFADIHTTKN
jgi:hypothetical protein